MDCMSRSIHSSVVNPRRASRYWSKSNFDSWMGLIEPRIHGTTRWSSLWKYSMSQMHHTPPTSSLGWALIVGELDDHALDAEVGELGLVDVGLLVEGDGDLVDDPVPAALLDRRLDQLGLAAVHVVLGEDLADGVDAGLDGGLVVGGGVLPEQVLQDVRRHDGVALDGLDQVLADDDAGEEQVDLVVEVALLRRAGVGRLRSRSRSSQLPPLRSRSPTRTSASACRSPWR